MEKKPGSGNDESMVLDLDSSLIMDDASGVRELPPVAAPAPVSATSPRPFDELRAKLARRDTPLPLPPPPVAAPRPPIVSPPAVAPAQARPATEDWFTELAAEIAATDPAPIATGPTPLPAVARTTTNRPPTTPAPPPMPAAPPRAPRATSTPPSPPPVVARSATAPAVPRTVTPNRVASDAPAVPRTVTPNRVASDAPAVPHTVTPNRVASDAPAVPRTVTPNRVATDVPAVGRTPTPNRRVDATPAVSRTQTGRPAPEASPNRPPVRADTAPVAADAIIATTPVDAPPAKRSVRVDTAPVAADAILETAPAIARAPTSSTPTSPATDDERLVREADALAQPFPTRAALLHAYRARIAALAGDAAQATAGVAQAAALAPGARFVAYVRRQLAERGDDPAALLAATRAEVPLAGDQAERTGLLWRIARLAPTAAEREQTWRQILELDPNDLGAWLALAAAAQDGATAIAAYDGAQAHAVDPVARAAFLASAAGLHQQTATAATRDAADATLRTPSEAVAGPRDAEGEAAARALLERAREVDPRSLVAHVGLETLHLHAGARAEHARMVAAEAAATGDLDPVLGLHERAGDLAWEVLRDGDAAAAAYEMAAALAPTDVVPLGKLASLYEQTHKHAKLVIVYERLLDRVTDPLRRGAILLRLGTLYETRLDQPADAVRAYREALDAAPTLAPAAQALARLYQTRREWDKVAEVLLVEINRLGDKALRAARYVAIAELVEANVARTPEIATRVTALYERALALDPTQAAALDALDRIHRATGAWDAILELHETQLAHAKHPMRVRALRMQLAQLYHDRARQPERAAEQLRLAMASPPDRLFALSALGRALADAGQWPEHVDILEEQAALLQGAAAGAGDDDRRELVAVLHRIAVVIEQRLGDPARALAAYERVLAIEPRHELAVHATLRLHLSQERWDDVIASERRLLELAERPEEAAILCHRIALVAEDHLARPDEAIAAYETALVYLPAYRPARVALERLLRVGGKFERLAGLLLEQAADAATPVERARLLCQAALVRELHGTAPTAPGSAADLYREALGLVPGMPGALWGLERIEIAAGNWTAATDVLASLLALAEHPRTRARLLVHAARMHEHRMRQPARAAVLFEAALAAAQGGATDLAPSITFERLRLALANGERAVASGELAAWVAAAGVAARAGGSDPALVTGLLRLRAAMATADGPAGEAYAAAAAAGAATPQVIEGLARTLAGPALADALTLRARTLAGSGGPGGDAALSALLHTAAAIIGAPDAAARACSEALAAQPDFMPALEGRRRIAERAGNWVLAAEASAQLARAAQHPDNKVDAFEVAARIRAERLGDPQAAIALYGEALAVIPGRPTTLARALALLESAGQWREAAQLIRDQAPHAADDAERARLLARRAGLLADRLGDRDGAIAELERARDLAPDAADGVAWATRLAALHEALAHWADAAAIYEELGAAGGAGAADVAARRAALLAQARIWTVEVPDYARAQRILDEANRLDPEDRAVLAQLAEVATLAGDLRRAAELYASLARRGPALARVQAQLARLDRLRELGEDGELDDSAVELAFADPAVVALVEEHFRARDGVARFVARAEAALATRTASDPQTVALRVSLGRIFGAQLARGTNAMSSGVSGSSGSSGSPGAASGSPAGGADLPVTARTVDYLQAAAAASPDDAALRVALGSALAGRDDTAAIAELRRALALDPTEAVAYRRLSEILARGGREIAAQLIDTAAALCGSDDALARAVAPPMFAQPLPASLLADDALTIIVGPVRTQDVRRIVALLDPFLHELFPDGKELLSGAAPLPDKYPIANVLRGIARALGVDTLNLYWRERAEPVLVATEPRAFVIAPEHVGEDASNRIRFDIAYALARCAAGSLLGHVVAPLEVRALLVALADKDAPDERDYRKRVAQVLPRRARKDLEKLVTEIKIDAASVKQWEAEERRRALGVGVVAAAGLRAVAHAACPDAFTAPTAEARRAALRANPLMLEALRFAVTDACWRAIQRFYGRT